MSNYLQYLKTTNKADVDDLILLLKQNEVLYELENYPANFNTTFNVDINHIEYVLKLQGEDFLRVEEIERNYFSNMIDQIDPDYYLFSFQDDELIDLIQESDQWSKLDYLLARKILTERGVQLDEKKLEVMKNQRIEKLSEPEKSQAFWIAVGYTFALSGGLLGILIGSHLWKHQRVLPNGQRVFDYEESDRKHGFRIFVIGILVFAAVVIRFIGRL